MYATPIPSATGLVHCIKYIITLKTQLLISLRQKTYNPVPIDKPGPGKSRYMDKAEPGLCLVYVLRIGGKLAAIELAVKAPN